jgi:hypothetical protein
LVVVQARFGLVGLKDDAFPRIKLFKKGMDTAKPVDLSGNMKDSKGLLDWTVEQTGVFVGVTVGVHDRDTWCGVGTRRLFRVASCAMQGQQEAQKWGQKRCVLFV